jgi:hypothetical protein
MLASLGTSLSDEQLIICLSKAYVCTWKLKWMHPRCQPNSKGIPLKGRCWSPGNGMPFEHQRRTQPTRTLLCVPWILASFSFAFVLYVYVVAHHRKKQYYITYCWYIMVHALKSRHALFFPSGKRQAGTPEFHMKERVLFCPWEWIKGIPGWCMEERWILWSLLSPHSRAGGRAA